MSENSPPDASSYTWQYTVFQQLTCDPYISLIDSYICLNGIGTVGPTNDCESLSSKPLRALHYCPSSLSEVVLPNNSIARGTEFNLTWAYHPGLGVDFDEIGSISITYIDVGTLQHINKILYTNIPLNHQILSMSIPFDVPITAVFTVTLTLTDSNYSNISSTSRTTMSLNSYDWYVGDWLGCGLHHQNALCGEAIEERSVICLLHNNLKNNYPIDMSQLPHISDYECTVNNAALITRPEVIYKDKPISFRNCSVYCQNNAICANQGTYCSCQSDSYWSQFCQCRQIYFTIQFLHIPDIFWGMTLNPNKFVPQPDILNHIQNSEKFHMYSSSNLRNDTLIQIVNQYFDQLEQIYAHLSKADKLQFQVDSWQFLPPVVPAPTNPDLVSSPATLTVTTRVLGPCGDDTTLNGFSSVIDIPREDYTIQEQLYNHVNTILASFTQYNDYILSNTTASPGIEVIIPIISPILSKFSSHIPISLSSEDGNPFFFDPDCVIAEMKTGQFTCEMSSDINPNTLLVAFHYTNSVVPYGISTFYIVMVIILLIFLVG